MDASNLINKYAPLVGSGLFQMMLPRIVKGFILTTLNSISLRELRVWIQQDKKLWDAISPDIQQKLYNVGPRLGKLDWLTSEWLLDAVQQKNPALASLFLNWPESRTWLDRQIQDIRSQLSNMPAAPAAG